MVPYSKFLVLASQFNDLSLERLEHFLIFVADVATTSLWVPDEIIQLFLLCHQQTVLFLSILPASFVFIELAA